MWAKIANTPAIADIIGRPRFQKYLKNIVKPLIGSEPFRWTECSPPSCLPTLIRWTSFVEESCGRQESKGIFILPQEALERTWNIYIDMPKFYRSFNNSTVLHQSIRRLKPNCWLDDEVVNAYLALLPVGEASFIKVTNTWVFPRLQDNDRKQGDFFKRLVGLLFL